MIVSEFIPKQGICRLTVESPDDLWTLRRLLAVGDTVVTKSSRVSKREGDYARPDKGERIKVTIALKVEGITLDSSVGRLRIRGKIIEASDDSVTKAGSHSLLISPGPGAHHQEGGLGPRRHADPQLLDGLRAQVPPRRHRQAGGGRRPAHGLAPHR